MQKVYESKTMEGRRGLFTNGLLVIRLFAGDDAATEAKKHGFEYIGSNLDGSCVCGQCREEGI